MFEEDMPGAADGYIKEGKLPLSTWFMEQKEAGNEIDPLEIQLSMLLAGQAVGAINDVKPAKAIIEDMVHGAIEVIRSGPRMITSSKL